MRIAIDMQALQATVGEPDFGAFWGWFSSLQRAASEVEWWLVFVDIEPSTQLRWRVLLAQYVPEERMLFVPLLHGEPSPPAREWLVATNTSLLAETLAQHGFDGSVLPIHPGGGGATWDWQTYGGTRPVRHVTVVMGEPVSLSDWLPTGVNTHLEAAKPSRGPRRPRLAYVSPLPPVRSGVADYSSVLVRALAEWYEVTVVVAQPVVTDEWILGHTQLADPKWLLSNARDLDRVLYHVGNSAAHDFMLPLMEAVPGVVMLHDFFLGNLLRHCQASGGVLGAHDIALVESHGLQGLQYQKAKGVEASIWAWPCCGLAVASALGVLVHSEFAIGLAQHWYGANASKNWRVLPMPRDHHAPAEDRSAVRARLGFGPDDYVVCSFGVLGPIKLNKELVRAWAQTELARNPTCYLVFVGEVDPGDYSDSLRAMMADEVLGGRVRITGYVDATVYQAYLLAADCAVQLRGNTRGETSASALDCLAHGLPTILNSHGSLAEIPDEVACLIDESASQPSLQGALVSLWRSAARRQALGQSAARYVADRHRPTVVAQRFFEAIEELYVSSSQPLAERLLSSLACRPRRSQVPPGAWPQLAHVLHLNQTSARQPRLWVDVSAIAHSDYQTGVQRVVRNVVLDLLESPPLGRRIELVYSPSGLPGFRRAYRYARQKLGLDVPPWLVDSVAEPVRGDIFLGLDLALAQIHDKQDVLEQWRIRGVAIHFVVYDILPLLRPDVFPQGAADAFQDWLHVVCKVSNGVSCISRAVAGELTDWLGTHLADVNPGLKIRHFHLGANLEASRPDDALEDDAAAGLLPPGARYAFLMVGTIEPRKGHKQTIAAFECLWKRGIDAHLVIVGKQGWMVEALMATLEAHPELGRRLHWFGALSDPLLRGVYRDSICLIAASEGEGFGLPLIEAARNGLPILARDLPAFREVAGEHATYFSGNEATDLADAVSAWLLAYQNHAVPDVSAMRWLNWHESTDELLANIGLTRPA